MSNNSDYGKPLFSHVNYCRRCCIPETQQGQEFDEMGVCKACQTSEHKMHISWAKKEKELRQILEDAKANAGDNYDCILPLSGGKDSFFQAHILCKVYGMKALGVTHNHNWYSETGWYNLQLLLETFDMDHVMLTLGRGRVNRLAKRSLEMIGDTCWHCHGAPNAFVLKMASTYQVPLIVWGESISEASGRATYNCPVHRYDRDYFLNVSQQKVTYEDMVCDYITKKDMAPFHVISQEEIDKENIRGIHLGDYVFWDDERQTEFVRDTYGWKETEVEGTYKGYKSAECIMPGMHDFTCYLKRGFGRATYQASVDVRNGLLTREEGFELAKDIDRTIPEALDYYLKITGYSIDEFYEIMKKHQVEKLKGCEMPVKQRQTKNKEVIMPFYEQVLEKHRNRRDPREVD